MHFSRITGFPIAHSLNQYVNCYFGNNISKSSIFSDFIIIPKFIGIRVTGVGSTGTLENNKLPSALNIGPARKTPKRKILFPKAMPFDVAKEP